MNTRNTKENTKEEIDTTTPKIPPKRSRQIKVKSNLQAGAGWGDLDCCSCYQGAPFMDGSGW